MLKLLFFNGLITRPKMSVVVSTFFQSRIESVFDVNITSVGVASSICEAPQKYDLFDNLKSWSCEYRFLTWTFSRNR